jgi:signal transduction histidine kinase
MHLSSCPTCQGYAERLRRLLKEEDSEYYIEQIPRAIDQSLEGLTRISTIVRSMKEFAHPDSDSKSYVDLNRAIESTVNVSRNEWKYVADLELNLEESLPSVFCSVNEINQVVLNMIVNASHAIQDVVGKSGNKGKITVKTHSLGNDQVEISISDTGAGIPTEIRDKIFDPFFTTKEVGKGTGQGLSIAHNFIVSHHHGSIKFDSTEGQQTTFHIILPIGDEQDELQEKLA